jgi:hypothetical protein
MLKIKSLLDYAIFCFGSNWCEMPILVLFRNITPGSAADKSGAAFATAKGVTLLAVRQQPLVYAQHGHELMG